MLGQSVSISLAGDYCHLIVQQLHCLVISSPKPFATLANSVVAGHRAVKRTLTPVHRFMKFRSFIALASATWSVASGINPKQRVEFQFTEKSSMMKILS